MSELDDLKNIWKTQVYKANIGDIKNPGGSLRDRLERERKKIRRSNILASICMSVVIFYLAYLSLYYHDQGWLFYASILAVIFLSIAVSILIWRRSLRKVKALSMSSESYIDFQLKRLKRNGQMIEYSPVYGFVLGLFINAYIYSLIYEKASAVFTFWMVNITWVYIMVVGFISYKYRVEKFRKNVEPLIEELEGVKNNL